MIGIYFSGTGNTQYLTRLFLDSISPNSPSFPMEHADAASLPAKEQEILFAYPVYYSNIPLVVREFIHHHKDLWKGKRIYILATMGLFSGDGTGVAARLLQSYGAHITGGLHVKMPDCIGDVKLLKKSLQANQAIVQAGHQKTLTAAAAYQAGTPSQDGLSPLCHVAGLFVQRLWFSNYVKHYSSALRINQGRCNGCGICVSLCPMKNLSCHQEKASAHGRCTMCYRCVNHCPHQAITLLGKQVLEQPLLAKYLPLSK